MSLAPFASWPRPIQIGSVEIQRDDHALVDVERPAVIAGQVIHVGGVADDQRVEPGRRHPLLRRREPRGELRFVERRVVLSEFHGCPSIASMMPAGVRVRTSGPSSPSSTVLEMKKSPRPVPISQERTWKLMPVSITRSLSRRRPGHACCRRSSSAARRCRRHSRNDGAGSAPGRRRSTTPCQAA